MHWILLFVCTAFLALHPISAAAKPHEVTIELVRAQEISHYSAAITDICHQVYAEYPYLYDGTNEDYTSYLAAYADSPDGLVCLASINSQVVGVITGIPLSESRSKYWDPFLSHGYDIHALYYIGELAFLPAYRGIGLEELCYDKLEAAVRELRKYSTLCLCEIDESLVARQPPQGYHNNDAFWRKHGFSQQRHLISEVLWNNCSEEQPSSHRFVFWTKKIF